MGDSTKTIDVGFSPEARAELLAMYTGMAMQGLLMSKDWAASDIAQEAVFTANATIDALEAYHTAAAKQANEDDKLLADLGVSDVSSSQ